MSLEYFREKIKRGLTDYYIVVVILLVGLSGFGLGRLSKIEDNKTPIIIRSTESEDIGANSQTASVKIGQYLASKTGNSYYLPWCAGAQRIKDSNKVWFKSSEEAIAAGYKKAANCKGL